MITNLPEKGAVKSYDEIRIALVKGMELGDDLRLRVAVGVFQSYHFYGQRTSRCFVK